MGKARHPTPRKSSVLTVRVGSTGRKSGESAVALKEPEMLCGEQPLLLATNNKHKKLSYAGRDEKAYLAVKDQFL
jgi:hypothetical protein